MQPADRILKITPDSSAGHYLITLYQVEQPLPLLEKLPFRITQLAAIKNGHRQLLATPIGALALIPTDENVEIVLASGSLPAFTITPELGTVSQSDLAAAIDIADRLYASTA